MRALALFVVLWVSNADASDGGEGRCPSRSPGYFGTGDVGGMRLWLPAPIWGGEVRRAQRWGSRNRHEDRSVRQGERARVLRFLSRVVLICLASYRPGL